MFAITGGVILTAEMAHRDTSLNMFNVLINTTADSASSFYFTAKDIYTYLRTPINITGFVNTFITCRVGILV